MSEQLASALNDELWRMLASKRGTRTLCHHLAYIARELEKIVELPKLLLRRAVKRAIRSQSRSLLEAEVGGALVDHVAGDSLKLSVPHLEESVRVLRATGVWSCVQAELPLAGCECFKDLAPGKTKEMIEAELEAKIDGYVRA